MKNVVIRASRVRSAVLLVVAAMFVAAGLMLLDSRAYIRLGRGLVVVFGVVTAWAVVRLLDPRPRVILDDGGVTDRTLGVGRIDWAHIRRAYARRARGRTLVCLELRDADAFVRRLSPFMRQLLRVQGRLGDGELAVDLTGTTAGAERVADLIMTEVARQEGGSAGTRG